MLLMNKTFHIQLYEMVNRMDEEILKFSNYIYKAEKECILAVNIQNFAMLR